MILLWEHVNQFLGKNALLTQNASQHLSCVREDVPRGLTSHSLT